MIQRIQTIYLALSAFLSGMLLKGPITRLVGEGGEDYRLLLTGMYRYEGGNAMVVEKSLPLAILVVLVTILFILAIFLFRRRKLQIRLTVLTTLLNIGILLLVLFYTFTGGIKLDSHYIFTIKTVFPLAGSIFGYLAFRAILKDELLVRSYDRIR